MNRQLSDSAAALPTAANRLIVYAVYDKDGQVDEFVIHSLAALRAHASRIVVVVNGALSSSGREDLAAVADDILVRENSGFDIGAQSEALRHLGSSISNFDEIVLTNDTWYGPTRSWEPVFARMASRTCHFWGLTDHRAARPNPVTGKGRVPYHLQSYWIAIRRPMFESARWRTYWRRLPELETYIDAVVQHELRFTEFFTSAGWVADVAFPFEWFDTDNPSLFEAESLLERGCPALKRRPLFHWPPLLDAHGVVGAWTLEAAAADGYPTDLILRNLARTVPPKAMNADVGLLTVLPADAPNSVTPLVTDSPRVLVVLHTEVADIGAALSRVSGIPGGYDLVVTTPDPAAARSIMTNIEPYRPAGRLTEVRIVPTTSSAESAHFVECRDVLLAAAHDIVVRLPIVREVTWHNDRLPAGDEIAHFGQNAEFVSSMIALCLQESGLGIVYPTVEHIGNGVLGKLWGELRDDFERVAAELGITVPLDDVSPLSPLGGIYVARPEALRLLFERPWDYDEFERTPHLAAVLARIPSYAVGQLGYYTRTVTTRANLSVSHPLIEYELGELSSTIPGSSSQKIDFLRHSGSVGVGSRGDIFRMYLRRRHSWLVHAARRLADPVRLPSRLISRGRSAR